jgi:phage terminase large subunit-like protein
MVRNNDIIHNNNPIDKWHISNAITITDAAGNIKVDKMKGSNKVDGVIAMIMAIGGYSKDKEEFIPSTGVALLEGETPVYD